MAILAASIIAAAITGGISTGQNLQKAMAQEVYTPRTGSAAQQQANRYKTAVSNGNISGNMSCNGSKSG